MLRFTALLLVLAATAAHSHSEIVLSELPELPIPEIDQLFPVDDMAAAFRWADRTPAIDAPLASVRWYVVALSEGQFRQVDALLAGIQQPQKSIPIGGFCDGLDGRFGVYLQGWGQSGVPGEYMETWGATLRALPVPSWNPGRSDWAAIDAGGSDFGYPNYLLKNRYSAVSGGWTAETELRDTGMSMRFRLTLVDDAYCAGEHTSHADGSPPHDRQLHFPFWQDGPYTDWLPIADLLDGNISAVRPSSWGQIKAQGE